MPQHNHRPVRWDPRELMERRVRMACTDDLGFEVAMEPGHSAEQKRTSPRWHSTAPRERVAGLPAAHSPDCCMLTWPILEDDCEC